MVSSYLYYTCRDSPVFPIRSHSQVPGVGLQHIFWRTRFNPITEGFTTSFMTILYFTLRHNLTVTSCLWTTSPLPFCWRFSSSSPANSSKQHTAGIYLSCNFALAPTSFWLGWGKSPGKYLMSTWIYGTSLRAGGWGAGGESQVFVFGRVLCYVYFSGDLCTFSSSFSPILYAILLFFFLSDSCL